MEIENEMFYIVKILSNKNASNIQVFNKLTEILAKKGDLNETISQKDIIRIFDLCVKPKDFYFILKNNAIVNCKNGFFTTTYNEDYTKRYDFDLFISKIEFIKSILIENLGI